MNSVVAVTRTARIATLFASSLSLLVFAGCGGGAMQSASQTGSASFSPTNSAAPNGSGSTGSGSASGSSNSGSSSSGSGSGSSASNAGSSSTNSGSNSASGGSASNGSGSTSNSGSGSASNSGSGSSGSGNSGNTPGPANAASAFLYVGVDDGYSYYGNTPNTGHPAIAGFAVASDGSLQALPGSPYAGPAGSLALLSSANAIYGASGSTLDLERINADGSLTNAGSLTAQPLSPSPGIYEGLNINLATQTLYATAIHGAGTNFLELYKAAGDGSLTASGSQQDTVDARQLFFTQSGTRAYQPFCYHLDGEIMGYNVAADGKLSHFDTKAAVPSLDGGNSTACPWSLSLSPDGKYVAAALNSEIGPQAALALYATNSDGTLTALSGSPFPRSAAASDISWDPSGRYLAVAAKDGLWIYSFVAGSAPVAVGGAPLVTASIDHLAFNKAGNLLFATSAASQKIYVFSFNSTAGTAVPAPGSPYNSNLAPLAIAVNER